MFVLAKSFWIVEISMMVKSDPLFRNNEHSKYPSLFKTRFLFWVKLIASMWQKEAECPSISMYIAIIKYSFIFFALNPFSLIRGFRVLSSFSIILSSSCFDFVSPILFMSYWSYLESVDDEELISDYLYYFIYIHAKIIISFLNPFAKPKLAMKFSSAH